MPAGIDAVVIFERNTVKYAIVVRGYEFALLKEFIHVSLEDQVTLNKLLRVSDRGVDEIYTIPKMM